jgi:hypothetical protein
VRTYTGVTGDPGVDGEASGRRRDADDEALPLGDKLTVGRDGAGYRGPGGHDHRRDARTVGQQAGHSHRRTTGRAAHHGIESPNPRGAQAPEDRFGIGPAVEHHHGPAGA